MFSPAESVSTRQLCAGLFAAMTLPMATLCAGYHWLWVLLGSAAAGILYYIMYVLLGDQQRPLPELTERLLGKAGSKAVFALTAAAFLFLAACLGARSSRAFPETTGFPAAGLAVLALAAWAAYGGIQTVLRCSALLFVGLAVIFLVVLGFSLPSAQAARLAPAQNASELLATLAVFTLPMLALYFQSEINKRNTRPFWWVLAAVILATATAAVTAACLSQPVAAGENSFYMLAKSVSVFGVIERFEALVSAAYLAGSFCFAGLLLSAAVKIGDYLLPKENKRQTVLAFFLLAAAVSLFAERVNTAWILGVQALFCGFLPLVILSVGSCKKV